MHSPHLRSARGTAGVETLLILALVAVFAAKAPSGSPGKDHWWQFWRKNPVVEVQKTQVELAATKAAAAVAVAAEQAKIDAAKTQQLKLAQDAAVGTGIAIAAAQATTASGKLPVRENETAATVNKTNTAAMEQAVGPADPARVRELELMVANLNAGVAAGAKALELMQGTLDRTVADKAAAQVEAARVKTEGEAKVAAIQTKFDAKQKELQTFALERDAIARSYERLMFWGKLGAGAAGLVLLYTVFLYFRLRGTHNLATDLVALQERTKAFVPPAALAALEQEIQQDWLTVHDGTAKAVGRIKAKLRI